MTKGLVGLDWCSKCVSGCTAVEALSRYELLLLLLLIHSFPVDSIINGSLFFALNIPRLAFHVSLLILPPPRFLQPSFLPSLYLSFHLMLSIHFSLILSSCCHFRHTIHSGRTKKWASSKHHVN